MPLPHIHQNIASRNSETLDRLLTLQPASVDDPWVLTIAYYKVLHFVESVADEIDENNLQLRSHADRLDFLGSRSVQAMQYFHKLHIISEFVRYGASSEGTVLRRAGEVFQAKNFRETVLRWLEIIEKSLLPAK